MELQALYQNAINFAGEKHYNHKIPGMKANYLAHLSNVAMEVLIASEHSKDFDIDYAIQVAILHDILEDTDANYAELQDEFGDRIAQGVLALTKDEYLPIEQQMRDSISRIKTLPYEVWAVKLADRITNMQTPPPHWNKERKIKYQEQANFIYNELKISNFYLAKRLKNKIESYEI